MGIEKKLENGKEIKISEENNKDEIDKLKEVYDGFVEVLAEYGDSDIYYHPQAYKELYRDKRKANVGESEKDMMDYFKAISEVEHKLTDKDYILRKIEVAKQIIKSLPLENRKDIIKVGIKYRIMWDNEWSVTNILTKNKEKGKE